MAVYVTVPVSTEVIEANPDCPVERMRTGC
jgi:hypothetical protein